MAHEKAIDAGEIVSTNNLHSQEKEALQFILEEIQKYRAIGTVEECRVAVEIIKKMYEHCEGSCGDCPYHNPNIPDKCMNDLLK